VINAEPLSTTEGGITPISAEADFVVKMDTEIMLQCCSGASQVGTSVSVPIRVRPATPGLVVPQGVISYKIQAPGEARQWTGWQTLDEGVAVITAALDHAGSYQVQVRYAGSRLFNASQTASQTLNVLNGLFLPITRH
jgi:hypothetical protein